MNNFDPEKDLDFSNVKPDETFRASLRFKLIEKLTRLETATKKTTLMENVFGKKLIFSLGGAVAVLLIALVAFQNLTPGTTRVAARQGFGELPALTASGGLGAGGMGGDSLGSAEAMSARSQSGGGGTAPAVALDSAKEAGLTIAPDGEYLPPIVTYIWNGEIPELPAEMTVFRDKPLDLGRTLIGTLAKLTGVGALERSSAGYLQNVSLTLPNIPYSFNIDQSGRYNFWSTDGYGEYRQPQPEDIPADSELVAIADQFLSEMGSDKAAYGQPFVDTSWKDYAILNSSDGRIMPSYIPAQATVAYPETIGGLPALNWSGYPDAGLSVNIDIFNKKAMGMNGRWQVERDQSLYPTKTKDEITAEINKGGVNPWWDGHGQTFTPEQEARRPKIEIVLDNSSLKLGYLQQYKWDRASSQTFWLPVLTLKGNFTDQWGNKNIYSMVVPAIQGDFFQRPEIMPLEKPMM